jgi:hypothetical protein
MIVVGDSTGMTIGYLDDSSSHQTIFTSSSITSVAVLNAPYDCLIGLVTGTLYCYPLSKLLPTGDPASWTTTKKDSGEVLSGWGENVSFFHWGHRLGVLLIAYCCYNKVSFSPSSSPLPPHRIFY